MKYINKCQTSANPLHILHPETPSYFLMGVTLHNLHSELCMYSTLVQPLKMNYGFPASENQTVKYTQCASTVAEYIRHVCTHHNTLMLQ